ncbi:MAG: glycosyltransferase, partial [Pseudomonadota bacterium]
MARGSEGRASILVVTNSLAYAINHRLHLFERLVAEGYSLTIAGSGKQADHEVFNRLGVSTIELQVERYRIDVVNDLALFFRIRRLVGKIRPDILHAFTVKPIFFGRAAIAGLPETARPKKFVGSFTGLGRLFEDDAHVGFRLVRACLGFLLRRGARGMPQAITTEAFADLETLVDDFGLEPEACVVTQGTGVEIAYPLPKERQGPVTFLFCGRLLVAKGILAFLDAARALLEEG